MTRLRETEEPMRGPDFERPAPDMIEVLYRASTASITTILRRQYEMGGRWF